jgi:hypothetical protein
MLNLSRKFIVSLTSVALLITFVSVSHADIFSDANQIINSPVGQCAKEAAPEISDFLKNDLASTRSACADLRNCKKDARDQKKDCKSECKNMKGDEKKSCKKSCRQAKRSSVKTCREVYKTTECRTARKNLLKNGIDKLIKLVTKSKCKTALKKLKKLK